MFKRANSSPSQAAGVLGIHLDDTSTAILQTALSSVPEFELAGAFHQYPGEKNAATLRSVWERHPAVCLIDLDYDPEAALESVEYMHRASAEPIAIFAISSKTDPASIIQTMRTGCAEYLFKPLQTERLVEALVQSTRKRREASSSGHIGKLITLMGVKGGVGTTTVAVHLACSLARSGKRTLLIDHHLEMGEATLHLRLEHHNYGFHELVRNLNRLDADLLQGFVLKHDSGLELLSSPEALGTATNVSPEAILDTTRWLLSTYDYVVIDCEPGLNERNLAVLELSDQLCLVATPDLPAIRNVSRYLDYLGRLSFPASKIEVLLNRSSKHSPIARDQIEKVLHRKITLTLPRQEDELNEAIGTGIPLSPGSRSDFMQGIKNWMHRLSGSSEDSSDSPSDIAAAHRSSRFTVLRLS